MDSQFPFFIRWLSDEEHHPSAGGSTVTLTRLEIAGDERTVDQYLGTPAQRPLDGVDVDWVASSDGTGLLAAVFDTASGAVGID